MTMMIDLTGKRAVVCGSTAGIGLASARGLAGAGAEVVLAARDEAKLRAAAAALPAGHGQRHRWAIADFNDPEAAAAAVRGVLEKDASRPVAHVLVNNTGGPPGGAIAEAMPSAFVDAFRAHVLTAQALVRVVLPGMRGAGYGRIINIISTSVKAPIPGLGVSNTIRGAMANWSKTLAGEVARQGVTVNNVLPGFTETARLAWLLASRAEKEGRTEAQVRAEAIAGVPAGRFASPDEVAAAVVFLASPMAGYITGINLPVDGGRTPSL